MIQLRRRIRKGDPLVMKKKCLGGVIGLSMLFLVACGPTSSKAMNSGTGSKVSETVTSKDFLAKVDNYLEAQNKLIKKHENGPSSEKAGDLITHAKRIVESKEYDN